MVAEECARESVALHEAQTHEANAAIGGMDASFVSAISETLLSVVSQSAPVLYLETLPGLRRLASDCGALFGKFVDTGFVCSDDIPTVPLKVEGTSQAGNFTVDTAEQIAGPVFENLKALCSRMKKKEFATFEARRASIVSHIESYKASKDRQDVRVMASSASALVALEAVPSKVGNVVKSLMNGIKVRYSLSNRNQWAYTLSSSKKAWFTRGALHLLWLVW